MHLPLQGLAALGAFILGCFVYMKVKKKWVKTLLLVVLGVALVVIFLLPDDNTGTHQKATTSGSNSLAINQSATASGSGVVNQAGRDLTIINQGVSEATVLAILKQKDISASGALASSYPGGYLLLGIANGRIIYEPNTNSFTMVASASINRTNNFLIVDIEYLKIQGLINLEEVNITESFPFIENRARASLLSPRVYYEVLDVSKNIFIIGVK